MTQQLAVHADEASGNALDVSGNGRDITVSSGNFIQRAAGKHGTGLQQISTAASAGPAIAPFLTASRTVMFDVKITSSFTGWICEHYRSTSMGSPNDTGIWGLLYLSGTLRWRAKNASNAVTDITIAPDLGVMHNIAATFSGTTLTIYRDGVLLNTGTVTGGLWASGADTFRIFDTVGTAAVIDNLRMYDTALTGPEVAALAGTAVTAPAAGTKVYFSNGAQASGVYEMTSGGILVQRNSFIIK